MPLYRRSSVDLSLESLVDLKSCVRQVVRRTISSDSQCTPRVDAKVGDAQRRFEKQQQMVAACCVAGTWISSADEPVNRTKHARILTFDRLKRSHTSSPQSPHTTSPTPSSSPRM
eukprot:c2602_g1_i1.p2 GENE.c2602_g1_i1~~c2602_g1_i1.p2  ORF type:complete len:115 (-),score=15.38 c2602_g1_i1:327-671(-)